MSNRYNFSNLVLLKVPSKLWTFLLVSPKIDVTLQSNVVQTALSGRKGMVKEYNGAKDYEVNMVGKIMSFLKDTPPLESLLLLRQCLEEAGSVWVFSPYLASFGIFQLVLKDFKIQQSVGAATINAPQYTIVFWSDRDVRLDITPASKMLEAVGG